MPLMLLAASWLGFSGPAAAISSQPTHTGPSSEISTAPLSTLAPGDTVQFAGNTWIILNPGTGYLLMQGSYGSQAFDSNTSLKGVTFDPTSSTNIASYLNDPDDSGGFYNGLSPADQALIQSTSWTTGSQGNESSSSVTCKIGLLSYSEFNTYEDVPGVQTKTTFVWCLRTPYSDNSGGAFVWFEGNDGNLHNNYASNPYDIRPALFLDPGISVSGINNGYGVGAVVVPLNLSTPTAALNGAAAQQAANVFNSTQTSSSNSEGIQVYVNGTLVQMDVAPMFVDGRFQVQMRPLFEALGANPPQWDSTDRTITDTMGNTTIKLQIASTTAYVNETKHTLDSPPLLIEGHTLIPVRFVSEAFGYNVKWDAANKQIDITTR